MADVLRRTRADLLSDFPGAVEALVVVRRGQVWTGEPGSSSNPVIDADDAQIQVLLGRTADCPRAPQSWDGVPLVFTTVDRSGIAPPAPSPAQTARLDRVYNTYLFACMKTAGFDLTITPAKEGDGFDYTFPPDQSGAASGGQFARCMEVARERRAAQEESRIEQQPND